LVHYHPSIRESGTQTSKKVPARENIRRGRRGRTVKKNRQKEKKNWEGRKKGYKVETGSIQAGKISEKKGHQEAG